MEGNIINLFMWGYQQHTQISFQVNAESLFSKISHKLNPKVFFIGVLVDNRDDRHPICLEPEDCGYTADDFSDIKNLAIQLEKVDKENMLFHSHPIAQQNHEKRLTTKSYIDAINKILKRKDFLKDTEYLVAYPTYVEGFLVFTVLSLNNETLNNYYSLRKDKTDERYTIYRSFLESTIHVFLKECSNALKDPNNSFNSNGRNVNELLRDAGRTFMYTVSSAGKNFFGLHGLYDACNEIASMKYEGAVGIGNIIIAPPGHKNVKITLQLKEPIKMNDFRKVRKFLELSDDNSSIISDSAEIFGLGEMRGKYNPKDESLFIISFTSHFKWEVLHDNNPLMIVEYREPSIPIDKIDRENFYSDFIRIFNDIEQSQIDDLWDISLEATKQKHGTMLVISDNAVEEAKRLGKQSFPLKPFKLSEKTVHQITSIDGAVLLDRNSVCHAIGVILDGLATDKGDSSRGARYNSAIRYYEHFGKDTSLIIILISEDGMINLIPDLKPQIKHSLILKSIDEFKALLNIDKLNHKSFNNGMQFFQSVNFYLTKDECEIVNKTRKEIEKNFSNDLSSIRIVYNDLKPNKEMNNSYYIIEDKN